MKRLTNILSYLWLLLLMAVTACSDLEEEVGPMQGEEEVELTIQTEVSGMKGSTRAQMEITEEISTIVAIAFDGSGALIKKVDATLTPTNDYQGTLKIKVPKRTQTIHFLGNYKTTDIERITTLETLNSFTTSDAATMHYWGRATYNGGNNLSVTLHRNMAKLTLKKGEGFTANSCYIAGFVNRNLSGTIVPSGYAVGDTPTIPDNVETETYEADNSLGNVYYLFEHANVKNNNPLYVIIEVAAKYYKIAFAAGDTYFPIIRNHEYTITIDGIDAMYAENNYTDAVNSQYPINDLVITSVPMTVTASPTEVLNQSGRTCTVTVTIPDGITELNVPTHDAFTITPPNELTEQDGKYAVTPGSNYAFTFTVKDGVEAGDKILSFSGRGKYKRAEGSVTVTLEQPAANAIKAVPVAYSLDYTTGENSVSDLLVNVTIPKDVTTLTFASDYFDAMVVGQALALTDDAYKITHGENAESTTIPVRLRLKQDKKADTNASFTFGSKDANVESAVIGNIDLNPINDENVRWQGNVPLNWNNYATIVPLKYEWFLDGNNFIPVGSKLNLEFTVTGGDSSWLEVFEIQGETEDEWTNHEFRELDNDNRYTADGNGNRTLSLTLTDAIFNTIKEIFRSDFLGEEKIAMAIRGAGITLTKVSVLPPAEVTPTVDITATPYVNSLNYSTNSVSDLIVNVTIPKEVSTLTFASEYFDAAVVVDTLLTAPTNGTYTVVHPNNGNGPTSTSVRLRLKNKTSTTSAGFTFSGTGENVTVTSAVIDKITLTEGGDEYVRWQGDAALQWGINAVQIPLLYSWFYDANNQLIIPVGSTLRVEYETLGNDASIQFAECNGTWNDDAYYFSELHAEYNNNGNNETMGLNLDNNTGIYNGTSKDLVLTQAVLDNMKENRTNLLGENDIVMAIQGGNVQLKKISVIPNNQAVNNQLDITLDFYSESENKANNDYNNLRLGESKLTLKVTIPEEDSRTYAGKVQLKGAFSSSNPYANANGAIHWDNSRDKNSSTISYGSGDQNGTVLEFTIVEGQTSYQIDWVFVTGSHYPGYGDIAFTYTISNANDNSYNISGDTSATIAFTNEPVALWTGERALEWSENYLRVDKQIPTGSVVTLNFTSTGGSFKLHERTGGADIIALPGINYGDNMGIISVNSGVTSYSFDVTNEIKVNGNNIYEYLNGLAINGSGVTMTSIVVKYPDGYVQGEEEVIFNLDFEDDKPIVGWGGVTSNVVYDEDKQSKVLEVKRGSDDDVGQLGISGLNFGGNYTVSMKLKTSTSVGTIRLVIQYSDGYAWRENKGFNVSELALNSWENNITWDVTISESADQFVIRLEGVEAGTVFYIDDLKLVKKNN